MLLKKVKNILDLQKKNLNVYLFFLDCFESIKKF